MKRFGVSKELNKKKRNSLGSPFGEGGGACTELPFMPAEPQAGRDRCHNPTRSVFGLCFGT